MASLGASEAALSGAAPASTSEAADKSQSINEPEPHADDGLDKQSSPQDKGPSKEDLDKQLRERKAAIQAVQLELMGDLPFAEVKPPENVLFVCKLNAVTQDEDLELIFGRFGKIVSCEIIRDAKTKDSLQYAFIEFDEKAACEAAYFKMQDVLIDDRRIHVDFSQSVSKLSDAWRKGANKQRRANASRGGWGGVEELEKKRQYRAHMDKREGEGYDMVHGDKTARGRHEGVQEDVRREARSLRSHRRDPDERRYARNRSRSPQRQERNMDSYSSSRRDGDGRRKETELDMRSRDQRHYTRDVKQHRDAGRYHDRHSDSYRSRR
ncbi:hypothetical protein CDD81_7233 [Ophiocordyceps australis]|uniref:Peptidyl-prolyl cis-trans isomerase n=1 Tax=Ophiocordyceps australis TaxID=1399860 RepID=A0A2C5Y3T9_9HYPO|nr:hypothetical protein CDD81_7233 [Ophiocordyceps australis]